MALFTDTNVVTEDDLLQYESSLNSVASSHGIDVETKIDLATTAIGDKLLFWLLNVGPSDPQWFNRRTLGLSTVVVTPTFHRWLCFDSLKRFFAEAYNAQLNTRFAAKLTEYQQEAQRTADAYFQSGTGIVFQPLPRPALPLVSVQSGNMPAQGMFIQTAWVDAIGEESALSPISGIVLSDSSSIAVSMAEGALSAPAAAVGWNVYGSSTQNNLTRQNSTPVPIGSAWELPATGLLQGTEPLDGQQPNSYIALYRPIRRG